MENKHAAGGRHVPDSEHNPAGAAAANAGADHATGTSTRGCNGIRAGRNADTAANDRGNAPASPSIGFLTRAKLEPSSVHAIVERTTTTVGYSITAGWNATRGQDPANGTARGRDGPGPTRPGSRATATIGYNEIRCGYTNRWSAVEYEHELRRRNTPNGL